MTAGGEFLQVKFSGYVVIGMLKMHKTVTGVKYLKLICIKMFLFLCS